MKLRKQRGMLLNPFRFSSAGEDPYFSQVALLLHCDGSDGAQVFKDSSSHNHAVAARGTAVTSVVNPKFGSACAVVDANYASYLEVANGAAFDFANSDFTIECYLQITATIGAAGGVVLGRWGTGPSTNTDWVLYVTTSRRLAFYVGTDTGVSIPAAESTVITNDGVWRHVAVTREGDIYRLFIDGAIAGSMTRSGAVPNSVSQSIRTNILSNSGAYMGAKYDEIRVTNGVARYTKNFTPPTAPFPNT